jgi:hypothetical protein
MKLMVEIYHELTAGGSGTGITWWLQALDCTHRMRLDNECRANKERTSSDTWATLVGSLVHAYREIWYNDLERQFNTNDVTFVADGCPENHFPWGQPIPYKMLAEAQDIFNAYRLLQPRPLGDILAVEKYFPRDEDDALKMQAAIGLTPITCKIDAFLTVTPQHARAIYERYNEVVTLGLWINDLKTAARHYPTHWEQFQASIQQRTYILIAHALGLHVQGSLIEVISKTRPISHKLVVVPYPTPHEVAVLKRTVQSINLRAQAPELQDEPNVNRCWWPSRCYHDEQGTCNKL